MTLWNNGEKGETLYYTHDLQKNVTALFGQAVERRAQYEYDPYGNPINTTGDAAALNPYRYSSEYHDEDLGLIYYNYRHYNPQDGRWINRDPIAEQGGINLYGFVRNRAINVVDVRGNVEYVVKIDQYDNGTAADGEELFQGFKVQGLNDQFEKYNSTIKQIEQAIEQLPDDMYIQCINNKEILINGQPFMHNKQNLLNYLNNEKKNMAVAVDTWEKAQAEILSILDNGFQPQDTITLYFHSSPGAEKERFVLRSPSPDKYITIKNKIESLNKSRILIENIIKKFMLAPFLCCERTQPPIQIVTCYQTDNKSPERFEYEEHKIDWPVQGQKTIKSPNIKRVVDIVK